MWTNQYIYEKNIQAKLTDENKVNNHNLIMFIEMKSEYRCRRWLCDLIHCSTVTDYTFWLSGQVVDSSVTGPELIF